MSKIVDDVKSGLKAVRGAGDTLRGSSMKVTDQALNNSGNHPETVTSQAKNRTLAEKGKQDMKMADEVGLREREKEANRGVTGTGSTVPGPAATTTRTTHAAASASYADGMTRPNNPQLR